MDVKKAAAKAHRMAVKMVAWLVSTLAVQSAGEKAQMTAEHWDGVLVPVSGMLSVE